MLISLDIEPLLCKPDKIKVAQISKRIAQYQVDVDVAALAIMLKKGYTWAPAIFRCGQRRAQNFESMQFIAVDIDKNNWQLADIIFTAEKQKIKPAIVHESMSSVVDNRKWRVIFVLDEPITDPGLALQIAKHLQTILGGDPAVVDVARLFYGSKADGISQVYPNNIIQISDLKKIEKVLPYPISQRIINEPATSASLNKMHKLSRIRLAYRMQEIYEVMSDPDNTTGSGYKSVWNSAMKLAQIDGVTSEAIHTVINKIAKESLAFENWQYWDKIDEIIDNAITWGRNHAHH